MLRIVIATLIIALAGPAAAQVTGALPPAKPKLKQLAIVTGDIVRIGDLIDNAGPAAGIAIFRSPDLGYTGGVPVARLLEAIAPHMNATLDAGGLSEVVVTRRSRPIAQTEIESQIARALAGHHGFGDARNISITFDREFRTVHVEPTATAELQVSRLQVDQRTGRFSIAFDLPGSMIARRLGLRFAGTAVESVQTAVLTRSLGRGDVIKASDVSMERRPKADVLGEFMNAEKAVGFAAKRPLQAGAVLRRDDLMKPELIRRNEAVTIAFEMPGVLLTARGKALEAGAAGDIISVLNIQSNRTVQATVAAPGRVVVSGGASVRASAIATAPEPSRPASQTVE